MPPATVQDLITQAYNQIGIPSPNTDQLNNGLFQFNSMMHSFEGIGNSTWMRASASITLVAGQRAYEVGYNGADLDIPFPPSRINFAYRDPGSSAACVQVTQISKQEYFALNDKTTSGVPTQFYYDQTYGTDKATVFVWPVPAAGDLPLLLTIDYQKRFTDLALGDDLNNFPPMWRESALYNLAVRIALPFGRPVTRELAQLAVDTLELANSQDYEQSPLKLIPDRRGL